ncbi:MAG: hypothetical protein ISR64_00885 [Deltaproteobacteria bacterium]|nr:hypothetical protein [Deltaproteobacteria bacterium]
MSTPAGGWRIVAPGKLILMGEYAVIDGAAGVVMAVDRYATVERKSLGLGNTPRDDLVSFARSETAARLGCSFSPGAFRADSSSLWQDGLKLGLGSSAAVAVCAVASTFHEVGKDVGLASTRRRMWGMAREIHERFQDSRGSGLDVAAALFGGVTHMRTGNTGSPPDFLPWTPPAGLRLIKVWSGKPASSPDLVGRVSRFGLQNPVEYGRVIDRMAETAERFAAEGPDSLHVVLESFNQYAALMDELGRRSGACIVTEQMAEVLAQARKAGGAAKPSGAGGGDFIVAAFPVNGAWEKFSQEAKAMGMVPMDLPVALEGVHVEADEMARGKGNDRQGN